MSLDIDSALQLRRNQSLTSIIRRELEQMIERGELSAGERLNENALAAKLGVSRGRSARPAAGWSRAVW